MRFLYNAKYAPLTDRMSFIDADIEQVICAYQKWMDEQFTPRHNKITEFRGNFEELLELSLPFNYPWKDVFFETAGKWTGLYTNLNSEVYVNKNMSRILNVPVIYTIAWSSKFKRVVNGWGGGFYLLSKRKIHKNFNDFRPGSLGI
jgi:hypothetical protein